MDDKTEIETDLEEATPENFGLDFRNGGIHIFGSAALILGFKARGFAEILGVTQEYEAYITRSASDDPILPETWKRFLKQLHGSYGKVLLRQYRIRNGLE